MYTRIAEYYVKEEKADEFRDRVKNLVLPVLQSQAGFVDLIELSSEDEPERMVGITLWNSREDAERYHEDHFEQILNSVRPLLIDEPSIEGYNVEASTVHGIAASNAA